MSGVVPVSGVVLVGGQGSRLQGRDKGLLELDGRPLIERVLALLRPQVDEVLISANRHLDRYAAYATTVLSDRLPGYQGPLAGIVEALRAASNTWLQIVPGDGPDLPGDLVERLSAAAQEAGAKIAVPFDGVRLQPIHALLHRDLRESLEAYLEQGHRRVLSWIEGLDPVKVDFSDCGAQFETVNTPQQYLRLQRRQARI